MAAAKPMYAAADVDWRDRRTLDRSWTLTAFFAITVLLHLDFAR